MYENYSNLARKKGFARHGRDVADSGRKQTAGQATDVSRRRLASVGAVGGGGCRIHPPGVVGTGSALSFAGVAAARNVAINGFEN